MMKTGETLSVLLWSYLTCRGEIFVVASQTLLSLIVRLQKVMSVAQGRAMLLDYARKSCGARLGLLFTLDQDRQVLTLLEKAGRHPHPSSLSPEDDLVELPLSGLFGSVLERQGFVDIPDISRNELSLPEERVFAWPHGRVLLSGLHQGQHQGVLVFSFSPAGARTLQGSRSEEEMLICTSLLSAYMIKDEAFQPVRKISEPSEQPRRRVKRTTHPSKVKNTEEEEPEPVAPEISSQHFVEILDVLTVLCELGLLVDTQLGLEEMDQHILQLLGPAMDAPAGCLWHYLPEQEIFRLQSVMGEPGLCVDFATAELNRLASTLSSGYVEPSYGLVIVPEEPSTLLVWHTLRYREQLLGALGLVLEQRPDLLPEQRLLLQTASEIIALILRHYDQHLAEKQALIEQERSRIAHEMHDSVAQDVAHVTQKLDYIQRILEIQPQTALNEIELARKLLNRSLRDLRYGISSLLPVPLEEQEFAEALKALLHEYSLNSPHLKITCDMENLALWPQALQAPVYRFMQEALNNIRKHASASEVSIRLRHVAGLGIVQVSDNGQGFVLEQVRNSPLNRETTTLRMGLMTMEERVRQAGGALEIRSKPGEGTILKARFPLTQTSAILTEREREVLSLLVDGLTNRAISERLSVSLETVKSHVHHIMQKMHVKDRTQAAVVATRQQWL
jgi:signal transduction histidine kinase/DNA-binding CsgD family transcriptional regulator